MSLSFSPQSEEDVLNLLQPGIYDFSVTEAVDAISKKTGNPMIKLTIMVWDNQGRERVIYDYLLTSMMYKIKHFCDATGLEDKYQAGSFCANDCVGRTGKCKLIIQEQDGYAPKNSVQDYVKVDKKLAETKPDDDFGSDPIPF